MMFFTVLDDIVETSRPCLAMNLLAHRAGDADIALPASGPNAYSGYP